MDGFEFGPSPTQLGRTVLELREALGLELDQLAERSGLPRATVEALERGRHDADLETLLALAHGLGVRLSSLAAMAERSTSDRNR